MRVVSRYLPAAVAVLAVAGCAQGVAGSADSSSGSATAGPSAPGAPGAVAGGTAVDAAAAVRGSYATTVAAKSVRVDLVERISGLGDLGDLSVSSVGTVDFVHDAAQFTVSTGALGTTEVRVLSGTVYEKLPAPLARMLNGKTWVKVALPNAGALGPGVGSGLTDQLSILTDVSSSVTRVGAPGSASVAGVRTTEYLAQVDRSKVLARAGLGSATSATSAAGRIPVHIWIDAQGRTRQLQLSMSVSGAAFRAAGTTVTVGLTEKLSGYGAGVQVSAPPASQTTDLGDLGSLGALLSRGGGGSNGGASNGGGSLASPSATS